MFLCKCNNCENTYIDNNPSDKSHDVDEVFDFEDLTLLEEDGHGFYGCPICNTDGYLSDVTSVHDFKASNG